MNWQETEKIDTSIREGGGEGGLLGGRELIRDDGGEEGETRDERGTEAEVVEKVQ